MMNYKPLIEIWGDSVDPKSLVKAIIAAVIFTLGAHLLAPSENETMGLFFGLAGAVISFAVASFFIKPKRNVEERDEQ